MQDLPESPPKCMDEAQSKEKHPKEGVSPPRNLLNFNLQDSKDLSTRTTEANSNPFASPRESGKELNSMPRAQGEATEGWSFQGRRRHAPKLASPRQEMPQPPSTLSRTPQRDATPGGKRGIPHSEIHPSFFTALGIPVPANKEPVRTKIWPVLTRVKNDQKETLVHSKNQAPPSLSLNIRFSGPMEMGDAVWDPSSAWPELI